MKLRIKNLLLAVIASTFLSCGGEKAAPANRATLLTDEGCRELLQRMTDTMAGPSGQKSLRIRRQEDIEEQLSKLTPRQTTPFYLFKTSTRDVISDGGPLQSLYAVDRRNGVVYQLFGEQNNVNDFNAVVSKSDLVIDLPDKAISVADLYETLTRDPRFSLVRDGTQLVGDLTDYYDPKHLHEREARERALRILQRRGVKERDTHYSPRAAKEPDGHSYGVSLYSLEVYATAPHLRHVTLKVQGNGVISDVTASTAAFLGQSPWCVPSVLSVCEKER